MRIGSLFSGAGGLDLAVEAVFSGTVVWQAEIDKAASKVLAHRFPGVPNLGSVTDIDWATVSPVDVLCGGFPCQDVSAAGKRAGIKAGTRSGLWSEFAEAIDALRPQYVVIENVRGLLNANANRPMEPGRDALGEGADRPVLRAIGAVLGDICDIGGYEARWVTVAAADVGAPHRRERVFILASDASRNGRGWGAERHLDEQAAQLAAPRRDDADRRVLADGRDIGRPSTSHSASHGWDEGRPEPARLQRGFDAAVSGDGHGVDTPLLPTPCVVDRLATGEMTLDEWDESRRAQKEKGVGSFGPRGDSLGAAVMRVDQGVVDERPDYSTTKARGHGVDVTLLPTPCAGDFKDSTASPGAVARNTPSLGAVEYYLPTPNASDASGGGQHPDKRVGHSRQLIDYALLCTPSAADGGGGHLSRSGERNGELLLPGQAREMVTAWGKYEPAIRRWETVLGKPAPPPTEPNKNGNPRLSAAFSEWLMGWPAGWVTDPAIGISRNDQLRIVGNGVCPQQAVAALRYLLAVTA